MQSHCANSEYANIASDPSILSTPCRGNSRQLCELNTSNRALTAPCIETSVHVISSERQTPNYRQPVALLPTHSTTTKQKALPNQKLSWKHSHTLCSIIFHCIIHSVSPNLLACTCSPLIASLSMHRHHHLWFRPTALVELVGSLW
jgi:hypothetical protein